jgi:hypothetical protein
LLSVAACEDDKISTQASCRSPTDRAPDGSLCGDRAPAVAPRVVALANNPAPVPRTFSNCTEAFAAGRANIPRGESGYSLELDADNDGIACER